MSGVIDSVKDERLRSIRELSTRDGREASGRCVLEGDALLGQALDAGAELEFVVLAVGTPTELTGRLDAAGVAVFEARESVLRQVLRTQRPVTALGVAALRETSRSFSGDFAVVLDGVADPGNLGTIVRTACGLGALDVVCTDPDTDLTSRRVLDTSRASVLRTAVHRYPDVDTALESLRVNGFQVITTSPRGRVVQSLAPLADRPVALVVGNETDGVSEAALAGADLVVRIPMAGDVESLNVGVATGLGIAELRLRMVLAGLADRARNTLEHRLGTALASVRAATAERLAELDHLTADQLAVLTAYAAGTPAADLPGEAQATESLLHNGFLTDTDAGTAITDAGRHALATLWTAHADAERATLGRLTATERDRLLALLAKLTDG